METGGDAGGDSESDLVQCPGKNGNPPHGCKAEAMTQFGVCSMCFLTKTNKSYIRENRNHTRLKKNDTVKDNIMKAKDQILAPWEREQLNPFLLKDMNGEELYNAVKSLSMSKHGKAWREKLRSIETGMNQLFTAYGVSTVLIGYQKKQTGGDNYEVVGPAKVLAGLDLVIDKDKSGKIINKFPFARDLIQQKMRITYPERKVGSAVQVEIASKLLAGLRGLSHLEKPVIQFSLTEEQIQAFDYKIMNAANEPEYEDDKYDDEDGVENAEEKMDNLNKTEDEESDDKEKPSAVMEEDSSVNLHEIEESDQTVQLGINVQNSSGDGHTGTVQELYLNKTEVSHQGMVVYEVAIQSDQNAKESETSNLLPKRKVSQNQEEEVTHERDKALKPQEIRKLTQNLPEQSKEPLGSSTTGIVSNLLYSQKSVSRKASPAEISLTNNPLEKGAIEEFSPPLVQIANASMITDSSKSGTGTGSKNHKRGRGINQQKVYQAPSVKKPKVQKPKLGQKQEKFLSKTKNASKALPSQSESSPPPGPSSSKSTVSKKSLKLKINDESAESILDK